MHGTALKTIPFFTTVCVDACQGAVHRGRLYRVGEKQCDHFHGLMQFFRYMEQQLDAAAEVPDGLRCRSFDLEKGPDVHPLRIGQEQRGTLATFIIKVLFRQNASWQGSVLWVEEGREESFRSELELVLLMDSALKTGNFQQNAT